MLYSPSPQPSVSNLALLLVGKKTQVLFDKTVDASNSKKPPSVHIWKDALLWTECIQFHHFMTNGWGNSGNSVWLYFMGSKITADGGCSHEIKRCLLLGRKVMTSLDSILKSRDITLSTKVHLVKAMVFPLVMYGCDSWTVKKAEHWRIDAFEPWCWRRLLRSLGLQGKPTSPS